MAHHSETIVVDFDDTLAITLNRDWANASPNVPLINKLNALYARGWTIHVVTARGQISCNGDHEYADRKYRQQIENWLYEHNVKYTSLSFQKKLALYYIDDKGITPEDFILKFNRVDLKGGMSGADVVYDSMADAVFKTAKNTHSVIEWYKFAEPHYNVPKIHSVIGDTIKMERLSDYSGSFQTILEVCRSFKNFPPMHTGILPHCYVDRCLHRVQVMAVLPKKDIELLTTIMHYAVEGTPKSFCHGDFSISNIMGGSINPNACYLIDPINDPTLLSSWVIDLAKLYMSIGLNCEDDERLKQIEEFAAESEISLDVLQAHEIGHLCRVYPYAAKLTDTNSAVKIFDRIEKQIKLFRDKVSQNIVSQSEVMNYVPR